MGLPGCSRCCLSLLYPFALITSMHTCPLPLANTCISLYEGRLWLPESSWLPAWMALSEQPSPMTYESWCINAPAPFHLPLLGEFWGDLHWLQEFLSWNKPQVLTVKPCSVTQPILTAFLCLPHSLSPYRCSLGATCTWILVSESISGVYQTKTQV